MFTTNTGFGNRYDSRRTTEPKSPNLPNSVRADSSAQAQPAAASAAYHVDVSVGGGEQSRNKLFVGPNIRMKGVEVQDCDTVMVEGQLDAIMDSRLVHVAEAGLFTGTVSVDVAEIWGRFEGDLTVRKQLIIHPTGRVTGYISYAKIKVEEGGEISGEVSTSIAPPGKAVLLATPTPERRIPGHHIRSRASPS